MDILFSAFIPKFLVSDISLRPFLTITLFESVKGATSATVPIAAKDVIPSLIGFLKCSYKALESNQATPAPEYSVMLFCIIGFKVKYSIEFASGIW